jgi:hypothetical protein
MPNYQSKRRRFEYAGIILGFLMAYLQLFQDLEKFFIEEQIVLEFEKHPATSDTFTYLVTGVVADENYLLDIIKLSPTPDNLKQVSFQYENYPRVLLTPNTITTPDTYHVSKDFLQNQYNEDNFHFEFLDDNRFSFQFEFTDTQPNQPQFECKVFTIENTSVPCEVKEKGGFFSFIRDMPWIFIGIALSLVLVFFIHFFDFLRGLSKKKYTSSDNERNTYRTVNRFFR